MEGIVVFLPGKTGTMSEGIYPYLYQGRNTCTPIYVEGDNPFTNDSLLPYDGKRVQVEGDLNEFGTYVIEKICIKETNDGTMS